MLPRFSYKIGRVAKFDQARGFGFIYRSYEDSPSPSQKHHFEDDEVCSDDNICGNLGPSSSAPNDHYYRDYNPGSCVFPAAARGLSIGEYLLGTLCSS